MNGLAAFCRINEALAAGWLMLFNSYLKDLGFVQELLGNKYAGFDSLSQLNFLYCY